MSRRGRAIGITQRVDVVPQRGERRDALDQAWIALLSQLGFLPVPIPNRADLVPAVLSDSSLAGVILSGGNDLVHFEGASTGAPERDACERALIDACAERDLPVLGVCRGMQMLCDHYGSRLEPIEGHVGGVHAIDVSKAAALDLSSRTQVNSFHRFGVYPAGLGSELYAVATAPDGSIEAVAHRRYRQAGIMWHPERPPHDPADTQLIRSFLGASDR